MTCRPDQGTAASQGERLAAAEAEDPEVADGPERAAFTRPPEPLGRVLNEACPDPVGDRPEPLHGRGYAEEVLAHDCQRVLPCHGTDRVHVRQQRLGIQVIAGYLEACPGHRSGNGIAGVAGNQNPDPFVPGLSPQGREKPAEERPSTAAQDTVVHTQVLLEHHDEVVEPRQDGVRHGSGGHGRLCRGIPGLEQGTHRSLFSGEGQWSTGVSISAPAGPGHRSPPGADMTRPCLSGDVYPGR